MSFNPLQEKDYLRLPGRNKAVTTYHSRLRIAEMGDKAQAVVLRLAGVDEKILPDSRLVYKSQ
jgi:hypothetical protein